MPPHIITAHSIKEAKYKSVDTILTRGKYGKDQRNEKVKHVENLLTWIRCEDCELSEDPLTARQQIAFADDLINWVPTEHDYTYGTEAREEDSLEKTIQLLKEHPETRRAVIPLFKPRHVGKENIPCMVTLCLYMDDDELNLTVFGRSNEEVIAMQSDLYGLSRLVVWMAERIGCDVGYILLHIVNAHVRINSEADTIKKILEEWY
ncbi:hypothetical protein DU52_15435 [Methanosarcina mazei]|uniref:Thymidylate synthase/dCMP hydroxymethylase domain-containing protein n=1 Tax=Methanosarcina mazei TaxID=2209 RepID=A0A0F8E3S9_METMZ|nr:thymidylate synthase [Methanosarcina mazei]KKG35332.1 hypothetical protein DU52_15435 [Methanosarcina mazei]